MSKTPPKPIAQPAQPIESGDVYGLFNSLVTGEGMPQFDDPRLMRAVEQALLLADRAISYYKQNVRVYYPNWTRDLLPVSEAEMRRMRTGLDKLKGELAQVIGNERAA